jgi:hypothetical protein
LREGVIRRSIHGARVGASWGDWHDQGAASQRLALPRFRGDAEVLRKLPRLPLASALAITTTKTGRGANVLHTLYEMGDGSYLAFFEAPEQPFAFKRQHDFDLQIALEVDRATSVDNDPHGADWRT